MQISSKLNDSMIQAQQHRQQLQELTLSGHCSIRVCDHCALLQGEWEYRNHQSAVLVHTYSHVQRGAEGKLRCSGCLWENSNVEHVIFQAGLWTSRAGHLGRKDHMNGYLTEATTALLDQFHTFPLLSSWSEKADTPFQQIPTQSIHEW